MGNKECNYCINGIVKTSYDEKMCQECEIKTGNLNGVKSTVSFHKLNGLTPTFVSCRDKVYEEIGELMKLLGKEQRASGEQSSEHDSYTNWVYQVVDEALDSAQALVTLINTLADENDLDIQGEIGRREAKLREKGYLV